MIEASFQSPPAEWSAPRTLPSWFIIGTLVVLAAQAVTVWVHGGNWTYLLRVGPETPLRARIELELGDVGQPSPVLHDGQIYYVIARDPLGRHGVPGLLSDEPQYRYRRILYPVLAGGVGLFDPRVTLWGLILWAAIGAGLVTVAMVDLCQTWRLPRWTALLALANPGLLLSAFVLSPDALALGLALAGMALWVRDRHTPAIVLLALAALTRETYILISVGLAAWSCHEKQTRAALAGAVLPLVPVLAWSIWLAHALPAGSIAARNFTLPFTGIVKALPVWFTPAAGTNAGDIVLGLLGLGLLAGSIILIFLCRNRLLVWHLALWIALGLAASFYVWGRANNALRVLAPLWVFAALSLGVYLSHRRTLQQPDPSNSVRLQ